jgi:hypothetical protein
MTACDMQRGEIELSLCSIGIALFRQRIFSSGVRKEIKYPKDSTAEKPNAVVVSGWRLKRWYLDIQTHNKIVTKEKPTAAVAAVIFFSVKY